MRIAVPGAGEVSAVLAGDRTATAAVLLAHGAGNNMDSEFMRIFNEGLAERGFFAARFNFPYMEARRKLPDQRPMLETCYREVADFVRAQLSPQSPAPPRLVLSGKSMGGRIASHLAASGYDAAALVFLGYPLHPPGKPEKMRDQHLYGIRCPMLFLSGTRDNFAERELLAPVVERIGPHATLIWIEGGDHSFRVRSRPQKEIYAEALDTIADWVRRVL